MVVMVSAMSDPCSSNCVSFSARLIRWQKMHGRHDLPWQQTRDAYRVWLAEIMLQQTQVCAVIPYYHRFLTRFPTLAALAAAPLPSLLEAWAGLGYYARARNLHRCAQTIVNEYGGCFPPDVVDLARLPGVGRTTAGAVSVFAFGRRAAILDGNVKRVLSRCFGIEGADSAADDERRLWALAESLLPAVDIESYTQGLMDLGATVCLRRAAKCAACPLQGACIAYATGRQAELPAPRKRKPLPERQVTLALLCAGQRVLFERRPPSGIWGGLLSLPELGDRTLAQFARRRGLSILATDQPPPARHAFTHFVLTISVLQGETEVCHQRASEPTEIWLPYEEIAAAALPAPIRRLVQAAILCGSQVTPPAEGEIRPIAQRPKATPQASVTNPAAQPARLSRPKASTATPKTTGPIRPPAKPIDE